MRKRYDMTEFARSIKLDEGKREPDPSSTKSLTRATQQAVDAILMLTDGEVTCCEGCGSYFTYDHLLTNVSDPDKPIEICPYYGGIWVG